MLHLATSLPHEIWREIFQFATGVPDSLACFAQDYRGSRRDTSSRPYKRYKTSLATKLAICRVSRTWNVVATPLLYERIVISSSDGDRRSRRKQIGRLLSTLGPHSLGPSCVHSSAREAGTITSIRLGAFIRRLDLTFPEGREGTEFSEANASGILVQLVGQLPNLQVFGIRTSRGTSPLDTLEALSPTLRHLHWRTASTVADFRIPISPFLDFVENHPILETVHIMYNFQDVAPGPESASLWEGKSCPSVRHWVLRWNQVDVLAAVPTTVLPNLEAVTYPYYPHMNANLERLTNFISIHGSRLKTIRVSPHMRLKCVLKALTRWCPKLREVHLVYKRRLITSSAIAQASMVVTMPKITTLGLSLYNYEEKNHGAGWQRAIMVQWKDVFPNLQTITLLEDKDVESLGKMAEQDDIVKHCQEYGVGLWDDLGNIFSGMVDDI